MRKLALAVLLTIGPAHSFAPADVRFRIRVDRQAANVVFCYGYDSDDSQAARSCEPLAGADAPSVFWRTFKAIPPGDYIGYVELYQRLRGRVDVVRRTFVVLET